MKTIACASPLVPPEWIESHGLRPSRARLRPVEGRSPVAAARGVCPYAGALADAALSGMDSSGLVMTTTCDQMRYAAALVEQNGDLPVFLMNVPSTWQTPSARKLYLEELGRLGDFLVRLGGTAPSQGDLSRVMLEYDLARSKLRAARTRMSARQFAQALAGLGASDGPAPDAGLGEPPAARVPLAVVGGPLLETDYVLFDLVEQAGARLVLNATEGGERTLPGPFDPQRLWDDPLQELADAYFGTIPDVFRRPNGGLYEWLGDQIAARGVRGILFRRYLWCDLWHAELHRLKQWSPVPVLDIDGGDQDRSATSRTLGRLEAFVETLLDGGRTK
jgi:benzoyl-CoA reductase/2-hydroxyglutaryl-CoA dehydratase subunit BcrC/BadD/HgdB